MGVNRSSYVCLPCRGSYKQGYEHGPEHRCPRCGEPMVGVGSAFQPPRRRDDEGWRVLSVLLHAGVRFRTSCCQGCGPGYRPRTLAEVKARVAYARRTGEPLAEALVRPVV
ncbi:deoxyxylulose-5-phosphate synthase [Streptomyces sp. NPDC035033]|uniref:deoxyxylulose-5-phosphate synthase n=1 Tax=Streptomyces sp. NPDC035033 TaxID=3155368 RepID=UPI003405429B